MEAGGARLRKVVAGAALIALFGWYAKYQFENPPHERVQRARGGDSREVVVGGSITDATGRGVEGATVRVYGFGDDVELLGREILATSRATTDARGRFTLAGSFGAVVEIAIDHEDHPPLRARVAADRASDCSLTFAAAERFRLVLADEQGRARAGAGVVLDAGEELRRLDPARVVATQVGARRVLQAADIERDGSGRPARVLRAMVVLGAVEPAPPRVELVLRATREIVPDPPPEGAIVGEGFAPWWGTVLALTLVAAGAPIASRDVSVNSGGGWTGRATTSGAGRIDVALAPGLHDLEFRADGLAPRRFEVRAGLAGRRLATLRWRDAAGPATGALDER